MLTQFLFMVLPAMASTGHFDPPDLNFEAELHRRYMMNDQGQPPAALAKDAYIENYNIQAGENLWSLSQILYGDGNYWPRVWAQNRSITNPHLIRPGHALQFLMGSEDDTPAFRFSEQGEEPQGPELTAGSGSPAIEIPPPEVMPKPVIRVPPSFPEWQDVYRKAPRPIIDERGIVNNRAKPHERTLLRAFVQEQPLDPIGYFLENDTESGLPVNNQYVYVKIKKGEGQVGQKLMVAHYAGKIRNTESSFGDEIKAYLIQVSAEIELTESVPRQGKDSSDSEKFDRFRALVTSTTGLSLAESVLIPGTIPVVDLHLSGPHGSAVARIIGSERNVASQLYGQGDVVFLDKGTAAGVEVGQLLDLFANRKSRFADTPIEYSPASSGILKVVRVTANLATAVILEAHDGVLQGDKVDQSARKGDTERHDHVQLNGVEGGEIKAEQSDFVN